MPVSTINGRLIIRELTQEPALTLRSMGVIGTFDYPSLADNARMNDVETWQINLRTIESVLPVQQAADLLDTYYFFAIEMVRSYIGREYFVQDFTLRLGEVTLDVTCQNMICWNILAAFLDNMRLRAVNGLVAMYEGQVVNLATGFSVWVKLSIRPPRPRLP